GADVELEAEEPDGVPKAEEPDGVPKATIGTGSQRRDLEALRRHERIREAESETSRTEVAFLGSEAKIGKMEREILHHDLSGGSSGTGGNADGTGFRGARPTVPELTGCTYTTLIKCDPLPFNGTEGAVGLCQWFEKLESVFQISECKEKDMVKFAIATLRGRALTWWNERTKALGIEAANNTPWSEEKGHRKRDCPKLGRNRQGGNTRRGVYQLGTVNAQEDLKVVIGTFLLNNHYATALFDLGADRSFVSTKFSTLINIKPVEIDTSYEVELADGKIARKYIENGCELFLAQVTRTVYKEKRVEDVPVIRDFPEVFLEDLP
nr:putative reverse transcriptase domain-containing protein [Tanacetum cinerariifolium]